MTPHSMACNEATMAWMRTQIPAAPGDLYGRDGMPMFSGLPILIDPKVGDGVMEFRVSDGTVLSRFVFELPA